MEHLTAFLTRMPKVELHVHLESTMPGEMLARFAARQGRELPRPAERLYDCSAEDLSDFLAFLDNICSFVGTPEELAEAAEHAALESGRELILYSEMILNPTHWPQFSVPEIIAAVTAGFDRAAAQGGADCRFTLSLSRTQTGAEAMALVEDMKAHRTHRLVGLSIDGNEALAVVTLSRDDPTFLGGLTLTEELRRAAEFAYMSREELLACQEAAVDAAFCGPETKNFLRRALAEFQQS